jgi:hypothetical protein
MADTAFINNSPYLDQIAGLFTHISRTLEVDVSSFFPIKLRLLRSHVYISMGPE